MSKHHAEEQAELDLRMPWWMWWLGPVVLVATIAASVVWPWGWAS